MNLQADDCNKFVLLFNLIPRGRSVHLDWTKGLNLTFPCSPQVRSYISGCRKVDFEFCVLAKNGRLDISSQVLV